MYSKPRDRGQLLTGVLPGFSDGERALLLLTAPPGGLASRPDLLFFTRRGMIKRTPAAEYDVRSRRYPAVTLKQGDALLAVMPARRDSGPVSGSEDASVLFLTRQGMSIRFALSEVPVQGRTAAGVRAVSVDASDEAVFAGLLSDEDDLVLFSERGWAKRLPAMTFEPQSRGGKGARCFAFQRNGSNGTVIAGVSLMPASAPACWSLSSVPRRPCFPARKSFSSPGPAKACPMSWPSWTMWSPMF